MPRGASSTRAKRSNKSDNTDLLGNLSDSIKENTMTTTETEKTEAPTFDFEVQELPEDYEPERKNPGRNRTPSVFDEILPKAYGKGYQSVAHDGNEEKKKFLLAELTKAKSHLGYGMDQNVTDTHIEFKVRDLQKRKPKAEKQAEGQQELIDAQGGADENGDNDE